MDDFISRAAAKKIVSLMVCAPSVKIQAEHSIDNLPAVDAVPVVRCKDCKYWYAEIGASTGWLPCQEIVTDRNWYCASGKRLDGDT